MRFNRETFYRCIFSSPRSRRIAHVRAWDATEAAQLFKTELRTEGIDERGTIEVFPIGAGEGERSAYRA
ncbi:MAG TPA: hypothetical protein VFG59_09530 [Anaeromyxobacter sp.]|nr:hypothetical protein [Anaeromyxobacter sp.]